MGLISSSDKTNQLRLVQIQNFLISNFEVGKMFLESEAKEIMAIVEKLNERLIIEADNLIDY